MCHEEERSLCELELRQLLAVETTLVSGSNVIVSERDVEVTRSPFLKQKIAVMLMSSSLEQLVERLSQMNNSIETAICNERFKVEIWKEHVVNQRSDNWVSASMDDMDGVDLPLLDASSTITDAIDSRQLTMQIARSIAGIDSAGNAVGSVDLQQPLIIYGVVRVANYWFFGKQTSNDGGWLQHQVKPRQYSTALSHRMARAVVNIAVPEVVAVKAIDLCCGIGTVLLEALSMNIDIVGNDNNPLVVRGARENIAHFHYTTTITIGDMQQIEHHYDTGIIDMPYNLCSVLADQDKLSMLQHAQRIVKRLVIVTVEPLDDLLTQVGFTIIDRGLFKKGNLTREIIVCTSARDQITDEQHMMF